MAERTFQIDGHQYEVELLKPSQATALVVRLHALAAEPLGALAPLLFAVADGDGAEVDDLDLGAMGSALRSVLLQLPIADVRALFATAARDDKPLAQDVAYDAAYEGNWGEWRKALWHIIRANGLIDFLPTTSAA